MAPRAQTFSLQRIIFLSVSVVLCLQVGWWIRLQIRDSGRLLEARTDALRAGRARAWQMDSLKLLALLHSQPDPSSRRGSVEGQVPAMPSLAERRQAIQAAYPHVELVPRPMAPDDPLLLDGTAYLTLRPGPLKDLQDERWHAVFRASTEGAFMVFAVLFGFVLIYRKLSEELDLKLRQRNFTSAVTHELKTPIASLRVWTETLFTRELGPDQRQRIRGLMEKDLERLNELVGNLLDVARAESGSLVLHLVPLELGPWLGDICEGMDHRLGPGSLGLKLERSPEPLWVDADPKALGTVIENLLSNAYKYSGEPRQTTVTLDGDGDDVLIVVSDQGHGIAAKDLPRVFHRFFRVGDEMTRQVAGTGLGLFLVKEIVTRHKGEVRVASRGTGFGAAFTIRLPRRACPETA
ncbi:sensor histidine kinase [Geothrix fermentans]|jgi:two-component system phosphate regulon sensor histidine kinase PhoR|uniref:sensor histidine kinase n=1 Tax=Geothrix fermentans TaxID=44676 RepID=UPI000404BFE7|nr:HAMP domain-containing sensor histidine kinase [Geothrix fermentans]